MSHARPFATSVESASSKESAITAVAVESALLDSLPSHAPEDDRLASSAATAFSDMLTDLNAPAQEDRSRYIRNRAHRRPSFQRSLRGWSTANRQNRVP